jgi:hypothetical protein
VVYWENGQRNSSLAETKCLHLAEGDNRALHSALVRALIDELIERGLDLAVPRPFISVGPVPVVRLTEVFRQAAQSRIITSAHRINQGSIPDLSPPGTESDFYFVQADDPETAVGRVIPTDDRSLHVD